ncbi:MAG TPA: PEP-CTERM sorting domain-containing protein [Gemmatales bacterium]|nr:PEP-CTERM sorting domain-containing protein [Gemmatales bacterium]HMP60598.1 PEP-CTERM sorting domain-containing protein [Gemmatales bacterium]
MYRSCKLTALLTLATLVTAGSTVRAEPISSISGTIAHFVMNSNPVGGQANATITLSGLNSSVPDLTFNLGTISLSGGPHQIVGHPYSFYDVNPWSAGPLSMHTPTMQSALMSTSLTEAQTLGSGPKGGDVTLTISKDQLVLTGSATLLENFTGLDLSAFSAAAGGGLLSITLTSFPEYASFAGMLASGGTMEGTGTFTITGGQIASIPEPATIALWGLGLGGIVAWRRYRRA